MPLLPGPFKENGRRGPSTSQQSSETPVIDTPFYTEGPLPFIHSLFLRSLLLKEILVL